MIDNDEVLGHVSFWVGKVNMHKEPGGVWLPDPDQSSGAFVHRLNYCKKFWPETDYVEQVGIEIISGWQDAGGIGNYTNTKPVYGCFDGQVELAWQDGVATTPTPVNPYEYKVLVVLADYLDSENSDDFSAAEAENWFNGDPLRDFFYEQSYGKMDISADVIGWYTRQTNGEGSGCNPIANSNGGNFQGITNPDFANFLDQNNVSLIDYDHFVVVVDCLNATWGGHAYPLTVNGESIPAAIIKGVDHNGPSLHFVAHEMGHKLYGQNISHANGLDCLTNDYNSEDCFILEYGNYFDALGSWQGWARHFRADVKDKLGWFDQSQILEITQSGIYTVNPLETEGGIKAAKIKPWYTPATTHYLEFKNGHGFNSNLLSPDLVTNTEGLFVYKRQKGSDSNYNLIDASPTAASWEDDIRNVTLKPGMTFEDEIWGVSITTLTTSPSQVSFQVTLDENDYIHCDGPHLGYEIILDPEDLPTQNPQLGESERHTLSVEIYLENPEPTCAHQTYTNTLVDDAGLNVEIQTSEKIVYFEGRRKWFGAIGIPENLPEGAYTVRFEFTNQETGEVIPASYTYYTPNYHLVEMEYEELGTGAF
jgi:hypothetical protein